MLEAVHSPIDGDGLSCNNWVAGLPKGFLFTFRTQTAAALATVEEIQRKIPFRFKDDLVPTSPFQLLPPSAWCSDEKHDTTSNQVTSEQPKRKLKVLVQCSGTVLAKRDDRRCKIKTPNLCGHCKHHHPKGCESLQPGKPLSNQKRKSVSPSAGYERSGTPVFALSDVITHNDNVIRAVLTPVPDIFRFTGIASRVDVTLRYREGASADTVLKKITAAVKALFSDASFDLKRAKEILIEIRGDRAGYAYIFPKFKNGSTWIKLGITTEDEPPERIKTWKSQCFAGEAFLLGSKSCPTTQFQESNTLYRITNIERFERLIHCILRGVSKPKSDKDLVQKKTYVPTRTPCDDCRGTLHREEFYIGSLSVQKAVERVFALANQVATILNEDVIGDDVSCK